MLTTSFRELLSVFSLCPFLIEYLESKTSFNKNRYGEYFEYAYILKECFAAESCHHQGDHPLVIPEKKLFIRQSITQEVVHVSLGLCLNSACSFSLLLKGCSWGIKRSASVPSAAVPSPHRHTMIRPSFHVLRALRLWEQINPSLAC